MPSKGHLKYTQDELETRIDQYFDRCHEQDKRVTWPGLAVALGLSTETLRVWMLDEEGKYKAVSAAVKKASDRMSDEIQQRNDPMAIFQLKQQCYGGYTDKREQEHGQTLKINVSFGNSGANSTK